MMSKQRQFAAVAMMLSLAIGVSSASAVRADRFRYKTHTAGQHTQINTHQSTNRRKALKNALPTSSIHSNTVNWANLQYSMMV
jgi:hypothetical protein